ncbi:hypothetical protein ND16A_1564 [Thalassotalea sp. ND16A]|nr:hypothetical protein ND16A_1564 [Thalassotalea sp. ND16A]
MINYYFDFEFSFGVNGDENFALAFRFSFLVSRFSFLKQKT